MSIIKDPLLEPFHIGKDRYCYTVFETVTPDPKYADENSKGNTYEKSLGHHSHFGNALKAIAREKLHKNEQDYNSIKEYISNVRRMIGL